MSFFCKHVKNGRSNSEVFCVHSHTPAPAGGTNRTMEEIWQVRALWVDRNGNSTERLYCFNDPDRARKEVVRLFCHLGHVGADDRALAGVEIEGDFWTAHAGHTVVDSGTRPG